MALKTTAKRRIGASPEAIWKIVTDTDTWTTWHPEVQRAFWVSKLVEWVKGSTIRVTQALPPPWGTITLVYRIGRVEPTHLLEWDARGEGLDSDGSLQLESDGNGTQVVWTEALGGLKATLLGWRARSQRQEMADQVLANLARLAEGGGPTT
jgi:carbon monoxide dehydrogenase subunit G